MEIAKCRLGEKWIRNRAFRLGGIARRKSLSTGANCFNSFYNRFDSSQRTRSRPGGNCNFSNVDRDRQRGGFMVMTKRNFSKAGQAGALTTELVVAMAILASTMIPLSFSFLREQKLLKNYYQRAVAMEIVDGEMEVLQAGDWKTFTEGAHSYKTTAAAAKNLPDGKFTFTKQSDWLRLEWKSKNVNVVREGRGR